MSPRIKTAGGMVVLSTLIAAILLAGGPGGGGGEPTPTPTPEPGVANMWVDTTGGTCTRQGTAGSYSDAGACGTLAAAAAAASCGDTVRVKAGDYGISSVGRSDCTNTTRVSFYGENGARVDNGTGISGGSFTGGLCLEGNVTVDNVDVGGDLPFLCFFRSNNTWQNSTFEESATGANARRCALNIPEPILVASFAAASDPVLGNTKFLNNVVEPQHRYESYPANGCASDDQQYHLESMRVDENVNGLTVCGNHFQDGGDDNTSTIFITTLNPGVEPQNLTFCNNVLGTQDAFFSVAVNQNITSCINWKWAYNTFRKAIDNSTSNCSGSEWNDVQWVGNVGPMTTGSECAGVYSFNVWQGGGSPGCGGSDTWISGDNDELDQLNLAAGSYIPQSGSEAINAGETPGASDVCTDAAIVGSVDLRGDARPFGATGDCDSGAYEVG